MAGDQDTGWRVPTPPDLRVFAGYLLAGGIYVGVGVWKVDVLLSFWVGLVYLLLAAWAVPTLIRRLAR